MTAETEHTLTKHTKQSQWVPPIDEPNATIDRYVPGDGPTLYRYTCLCGWEQQTWRTDASRGLRLAHELHTARTP